MENIKEYFRVTYDELVNKVSWPSWDDLQSSTIIVMIASLLISLVIALIDFAGNSVLNVFYNLFE